MFTNVGRVAADSERAVQVPAQGSHGREAVPRPQDLAGQGHQCRSGILVRYLLTRDSLTQGCGAGAGSFWVILSRNPEFATALAPDQT